MNISRCWSVTGIWCCFIFITISNISNYMVLTVILSNKTSSAFLSMSCEFCTKKEINKCWNKREDIPNIIKMIHLTKQIFFVFDLNYDFICHHSNVDKACLILSWTEKPTHTGFMRGKTPLVFSKYNFKKRQNKSNWLLKNLMS